MRGPVVTDWDDSSKLLALLDILCSLWTMSHSLLLDSTIISTTSQKHLSNKSDCTLLALRSQLMCQVHSVVKVMTAIWYHIPPPNHLNLASLPLSLRPGLAVPLMCLVLILSIFITSKLNLDIFKSASRLLVSAAVSKSYRLMSSNIL